MAIAHKNYYPPDASVEVANDPAVQWHNRGTDRAWWKGGRIYKVPTGAPLRGRAGTSMAGWYYDWPKFAWIQPAVQGPPPGPPVHIVPRPTPTPAPPAPPAHHEHHHEEDHMMTHHCSHHHEKPSLYQGIAQHPWVPIIGALLMVGSDFMAQPQPPVIPDGLPDNVSKQWMMIYNQNLSLYQTRKAMLDKYGGILLALGLGNAAVTEQTKTQDLISQLRSAPQHHAPPMHHQAPPMHHDAHHQRGAM
jgi:hypothetical protein